MGLFDFVKDAGERIFGGGDDKPEAKPATPDAPQVDQAAVNRETASALMKVVKGMGLEVEDLGIDYSDGKAVVRGKVASQSEKEKVVLLVGNNQGVSQVDDQLVVEKPEPEAKMYTVKSGDTLSKISKEFYGDAIKYMTIFEANTPMLKDPNKIYPGQTLRIPPLNG